MSAKEKHTLPTDTQAHARTHTQTHFCTYILHATSLQTDQIFCRPIGCLMPEPEGGYQVRIKQPARLSSITCIPSHSRSWYHRDRRTHTFFLSFSAFLCADVCTVCGNHSSRSGEAICGILYVIYVERLVPPPPLYYNVLLSDDTSKCEIAVL